VGKVQNDLKLKHKGAMKRQKKRHEKEMGDAMRAQTLEMERLVLENNKADKAAARLAKQIAYMQGKVCSKPSPY